MPRLRIRHRTELRYSGTATESVNEVRMLPRPGPRVEVEAAEVAVEPATSVHRHSDSFGNAVTWFQVIEPHDALVVEAEAVVAVRRSLPQARRTAPEDQWRALGDPRYRDDMAEFLAASAYAAADSEVAALAESLALPESGGVDRWLVDLSHAVCDAITYDTGATAVHTPASEVARLRRGVCQDLAHVTIALCRQRGVPARYVSGWLHYLGANGPGESHAWIEAHVPEDGWVELDPTHPGRSDLDHVPVAVGRDYSDVPPIRGSYLGAPASNMTVWVDIREEPAGPKGP